MQSRTYYDVLEVSTDANAEEIQDAYELQLAYARISSDKKLIEDAYKCLGNPKTRAEYDASGRPSVQPYEDSLDDRIDRLFISPENTAWREELTQAMSRLLPADSRISRLLRPEPNTHEASIDWLDRGRELFHVRQDIESPDVIHIDQLHIDYVVHGQGVERVYKEQSSGYKCVKGADGNITFRSLDENDNLTLEQRLKLLDMKNNNNFDSEVVRQVGLSLASCGLGAGEIGRALRYYSNGIDNPATQKRLEQMRRKPESKEFLVCRGTTRDEMCVCYLDARGNVKIDRAKFPQGYPIIPRQLEGTINRLGQAKAVVNREKFRSEWSNLNAEQRGQRRGGPDENAHQDRFFQRRAPRAGGHRNAEVQESRKQNKK